MKEKMQSKNFIRIIVGAAIILLIFIGIWASQRTRQNLSKTYTIIEHQGEEAELPVRDTGELIIGVSSMTGDFDPVSAYVEGDKVISDLIFEPLIRADQNGIPELVLASGYEVSDDGRTYIFTLKEGVAFSDGTPLTAKVVKANFLYLAEKLYLTNNTLYEFCYSLKGYESEGDKGIQVIDDDHISFTFSEANGDHIWMFTLGIQKEELLSMEEGEISGLTLKEHFIGTGPYILAAEQLKDLSVHMETNDNYHADAAEHPVTITAAESTTLNYLFKNEKLDMALFNYDVYGTEALEDNAMISVYSTVKASTDYIGMNMSQGALEDTEVRRAISRAIDREQLAAEVYNGYAVSAETLYVPSFYGNGDLLKSQKTSLDEARKLLNAAGYSQGTDGIFTKDGERLQFELAIYNTEHNYTAAAIIKENLKEAGIGIEIKTYPMQDLYTKLYDERNFELYYMTWQDGVSPDLELRFGNNMAGSNPENWQSEKKDELLENLKTETDFSKRKNYYQEIARLFDQDVPQVLLVSQKKMVAARSGLAGIEIPLYQTAYWNVKELYVKE